MFSCCFSRFEFSVSILPTPACVKNNHPRSSRLSAHEPADTECFWFSPVFLSFVLPDLRAPACPARTGSETLRAARPALLVVDPAQPFARRPRSGPFGFAIVSVPQLDQESPGKHRPESSSRISNEAPL